MSAWIEINLDNLKSNIWAVRQRIGHQVKLMAVVKANAYGHGAVKIAQTCVKNGVDWLAVARLQEGIELRQHGITAPILNLGATLPHEISLLRRYAITPSVLDQSFAEALEKWARKNKEKVKCQIRIDVGYAGLGLTPREILPLLYQLLDSEWLEIEGLYTHISSAYRDDQELIARDLDRFDYLLQEIEDRGMSIPLIHAVSSPGIIKLPQAYYHMVRSGTSLYGMPSFKDQDDWGLKPLMQLKAKIVAIKHLEQGSITGYENSYQLDSPTRLATLSIGYAHGLFLFLLQQGRVLVGNKYAPIFGKAYMSHMFIDVTHIPDAQVGQEVVIMGAQGGQSISVEELAVQAGFDQVYCDVIGLLTQPLPKVYIENTKGKLPIVEVVRSKDYKGEDSNGTFR